MKSFTITLLTTLSSLSLISVAAAAADTTSTTAIPKSTDASSFLSEELTTVPTWATGKYATTLASALYSVATSFAESDEYTSIIDAIYSAAAKESDKQATEIVASLEASGWDWGAITTNGWYTSNVPKSYQTAVQKYDSAWDSAYTSVEAKAVATGSKNAAPKCTGMAVAGVAAFGVAAVAGVM